MDVRKKIIDNYRVVVTPVEPWVMRNDEDRLHQIMVRDMEKMSAQIRRHCDDVSDAEITWDTSFVCPDCGYNWGEESTIFNGGCCGADIARAEAAGIEVPE